MPTLISSNEVYKFTIADIEALVAAQLKLPAKFVKLDFKIDYDVTGNVTHVEATVDKKGVDAQHREFQK